MIKGKPWPKKDKQKLTRWFHSVTVSIRVLDFGFDAKYSENAIYQKLLDIGLLEEEEDCKHHFSSSFSLKLRFVKVIDMLTELKTDKLI